MWINRKAYQFIERRAAAGVSPIVLYGGRRAGKTFVIGDWLFFRAYNHCEQVLVVSSTDAQGRDGAYSDFCDIASEFGGRFAIQKTPKQIYTTFQRKGKVGRIRFKSFDEPSKAKGDACDWVFLNECNLLTYQHYLDISVNARKGVICDFNPTGRFWLNNIVSDDECYRMTWLDNRRNLTETQIKWFEDLKERAESPTATAVDVYNYRVNYLGEYGEIEGAIFTRGNLPIVSDAVPPLRNMIVVCDPSALCGGDFFACCVGGVAADGSVWVVDTFSENACDVLEVLQVIKSWCARYDVRGVYVETNGIPGGNFFQMVKRSNMPAKPMHSSVKKFERIVANFGAMTKTLRIASHANAESFMTQVYSFQRQHCEHDDNIDVINSFFTLQKIL